MAIKVSRIKISNILGVENMEIAPGSLTIFTGPNGAGKTSALEAIKSAIRGGHDATLLRKGKDKGEVVLELDDGRSIVETITSVNTNRKIVDANGRKITDNVTQIKALTNLLASNPLDFITAQPKDRAKVLLELMPIHIDADLVEKHTRVRPVLSPNVPDLDMLNKVQKDICDDRTGTNRAIFEKNASINQLKISLESYDDIPDEVVSDKAFQDQIQLITEKTEERCKNINQAVETERQSALSKEQQEVDSAKSKIIELEEKIRLLNEEISLVKSKSNANVTNIREEFKKLEREAETRKTEIKAEAEASKKVYQDNIANIEKMIERKAKKDQLNEIIKESHEQLCDLESDEKMQTESIKWIDTYRNSILESLPIAGLEVRNNEVFYYGTTFDRLNEAKKVELAIEVAKLKTGDLKLICVDGLERLDPVTFDAFVDRALQCGIQMIVTRVEQDQNEIKNGLQTIVHEAE